MLSRTNVAYPSIILMLVLFWLCGFAWSAFGARLALLDEDKSWSRATARKKMVWDRARCISNIAACYISVLQWVILSPSLLNVECWLSGIPTHTTPSTVISWWPTWIIDSCIHPRYHIQRNLRIPFNDMDAVEPNLSYSSSGHSSGYICTHSVGDNLFQTPDTPA